MGLFILLGTVVLTAILSPLFLVMLMRASRRPPEVDAEGRTVVGLTMGLMVLGICCAAFCLSMAWLSVLLILDPDPWSIGTALVPGFGALLFVLAGCAVYAVFCVSVRFDQHGIFYRELTRGRLVPWEDVTQVVDHPIVGTYLRTASGRIHLSKYRTGFHALLGELRSRGIPGADRRSLVRPV